ncbi:hypothetical protein CPB84DRAFT_1850439 [Gymnopilus junonius]|uniref:Survival Motor Neuron Gemin2-binding domain-containing protein n=1 Tax=Gymnopilus junonius TaxID=109634 RepID=A0A9P5NHI0_GYMJU|nr:hypothetical protein CPB84DRAFT_1850439 [Gymnopilus junonius]
MSTRTVISYDDITLPYDPVDEGEPTTQPPSRTEQPPPNKRRKKNNQKGKNRANPPRSNNGQQQNRPTNGFVSTSSKPTQRQEQEQYDESMQDEEGYYEEDEESRELTHEEIWDDSALVYAWEAAMEEYEAFNGPDKGWKKEPVKKSPLWYNIPPDSSKKLSSTSKAPTTASTSTGPDIATAHGEEEEHDSKPLDFDTFVPTHDPSLYPPSSAQVGSVAGRAPQVHYAIDDLAAGAMVSQDEAFQHALSAMYWGGYWTAMYHAQRRLQSQNVPPHPVLAETGEEGEEEEVLEGEGGEIQVDEEDELVSTQR